jgi:2,5-diketo-D-gluconate reductase A
LKDERIVAIAQRLDATPAQVVIAWHLAKGLSVIPKAGSPAHLADNWQSRTLALSDEDVAAIDAMDDPQGRMGPDPARF